MDLLYIQYSFISFYAEQYTDMLSITNYTREKPNIYLRTYIKYEIKNVSHLYMLVRYIIFYIMYT